MVHVKCGKHSWKKRLKIGISMDEDYWDAQIEGFEQAFKKPIWRDYLETQRKLLDEVFSLGLD
tara:strand:- start:16350 stop:16538 length:189 start_codon:yes stop_codon:yes gene_type:complete